MGRQFFDWRWLCRAKHVCIVDWEAFLFDMTYGELGYWINLHSIKYNREFFCGQACRMNVILRQAPNSLVWCNIATFHTIIYFTERFTWGRGWSSIRLHFWSMQEARDLWSKMSVTCDPGVQSGIVHKEDNTNADRINMNTMVYLNFFKDIRCIGNKYTHAYIII